MERHRLAEERSIALHRKVAEKLRDDPALLDRARARTEEWRAGGLVHGYYLEAWERWLALPVDALCRALVDPGERARALRQVSPFAGALSARERWAIHRSIGADATRAAREVERP